jgi:hypothetical protein
MTVGDYTGKFNCNSWQFNIPHAKRYSQSLLKRNNTDRPMVPYSTTPLYHTRRFLGRHIRASKTEMAESIHGTSFVEM